jgi:hypothetical protein
MMSISIEVLPSQPGSPAISVISCWPAAEHPVRLVPLTGSNQPTERRHHQQVPRRHDSLSSSTARNRSDQTATDLHERPQCSVDRACAQALGRPLGERSNEPVSLAAVIAAQRANHGVCLTRSRAGRWGCLRRGSTIGGTGMCRCAVRGDAELTRAALCTAIAVRGCEVTGVVFNTDLAIDSQHALHFRFERSFRAWRSPAGDLARSHDASAPGPTGCVGEHSQDGSVGARRSSRAAVRSRARIPTERQAIVELTWRGAAIWPVRSRAEAPAALTFVSRSRIFQQCARPATRAGRMLGRIP